jgi:hypothetical protein
MYPIIGHTPLPVSHARYRYGICIPLLERSVSNNGIHMYTVGYGICIPLFEHLHRTGVDSLELICDFPQCRVNEVRACAGVSATGTPPLPVRYLTHIPCASSREGWLYPQTPPCETHHAPTACIFQGGVSVQDGFAGLTQYRHQVLTVQPFLAVSLAHREHPQGADAAPLPVRIHTVHVWRTVQGGVCEDRHPSLYATHCICTTHLTGRGVCRYALLPVRDTLCVHDT